MRRPEVSLENYPEVYDFYENHTQNQKFAHLGHAVMGLVFRPSITFAEEGTAEEAIQDELDDDTHLAVYSNHLSELDQFTLLSVVQKEKVLHPLRGHIFIAAKAPLFTQPFYKGGTLLRRAVDELGAIPIYRNKDLKRMVLANAQNNPNFVSGIEEVKIPAEMQEFYNKALLRANEAQVAKLMHPGQHMGNFPEGERNRSNHTEVQELRPGFAYTACQAAERVKVSVLPIGLYYGEPTDYENLDVPHRFTPKVHIGMPFRIETNSPEELVRLVHPAIQRCVDIAVEASTK